MEQLPDDVLSHVLSYLPPPPFTHLLQINKFFLNHLNEEKYYKEWFLGDGCAGYTYPQIHKNYNKKGTTWKEYYKIVHNLPRDFQLVSLPDQYEPNNSSYNMIDMCLCNDTKNVLVCYGKMGVVMEFSAYPPFTLIQKWDIREKFSLPFNYGIVTTSGTEYYVAMNDGEGFGNWTVLQLLPQGEYKHITTLSKQDFIIFSGNKIIEVMKEEGKVTLQVRSYNTKWDITARYIRVIIAAPLVMLIERLNFQHDKVEYMLLNIDTGDVIATLPENFAHNPSETRAVANVKYVDDDSGKYWLVGVVKANKLSMWKVMQGAVTAMGDVFLNLNRKHATTSFAVSLFIHKNRVVIVYTDGALHVVKLPMEEEMQTTISAYSGGGGVSCVEITEDSRVFFGLNSGHAFAVDFFTPVPPLNEPSEVITQMKYSSVVNHVISWSLREIGYLYKLLFKANSQTEMETFFEKFELLKKLLHTIEAKTSRMQNRIGASLPYRTAVGEFGNLFTTWDTLHKLMKAESSTAVVVKLNELQRSLDQLIDADIYPHSPIRKLLASLLLKQSKEKRQKQIVHWAKQAKKVPKNISLVQIRDNMEIVKNELSDMPVLRKEVDAELKELEFVLFESLAQQISQAIELANKQEISKAESTKQQHIQAIIQQIFNSQDFDLMKPMIFSTLTNFSKTLESSTLHPLSSEPSDIDQLTRQLTGLLLSHGENSSNASAGLVEQDSDDDWYKQ